MPLDTKDYLNFSALAYLDFDTSAEGKSIGWLIDNKLIKKDDINKPELSALKDSSSPLRSYTLMYFEKDGVSGFAGVAFRSPQRNQEALQY